MTPLIITAGIAIVCLLIGHASTKAQNEPLFPSWALSAILLITGIVATTASVVASFANPFYHLTTSVAASFAIIGLVGLIRNK